MPGKETGYISLLLTEEVLKVAHLKSTSSGPSVVNLAFYNVNGLSDEDISAELKKILDQFNAARLNAVCVLPPSVTTTKNIEIPSLDPKEIGSIIDLQAGRHTPYSREEIIIGYINFGVYQKNYSKILLVIVNRETIMRQVNILQSVGVKAKKIFFAPEVEAKFYSKVSGLSSEDAPIGIIDINNNFTDFTIMLRGTAIACRSIPVGMSQIQQEGDSSKEKFINELKQSIESYQNEDIEKVPQKYILSDGRESTQSFQTSVAEALNAKLEIIPYSKKLNFSDFAKKVMDDNMAETFLDVVSPVFEEGCCQIDLLPEEIKTRYLLEKQSFEGIKFAALTIVFLVLAGSIFISKVSFKSSLLERIKKEYTDTAKDSRELEKISTKTRIIKAYLNSRLVPLESVRELYNMIPDEMYLTNFSLDDNGKILIEGTSDSMSQVFALVGTLEDSELFKGVKTKSTTAKKERGKDVASFEIVFMLESAEDTGDEEDLGEEAPAEEKKEE